MRSKTAKRILEETSQETKDKVKEYTDNLVNNSFYCSIYHLSATESKRCKQQCNKCKQ